MSTHLDIELETATAFVTRVADYDLDIHVEMPSVEFGVPGPQGPQGPGGSAGAAANQITVTPIGGVQSTNVQAALQELDTEKPSYAYVDSHGVYVSPTPPADPTRWALWVDSS